MRIALITKNNERLECPKCGNHDLHIPLWDDDPYNTPEASPLEDGFCILKRGGCGFKGFRMDFDPTGQMKEEFKRCSQ